jgi:hypothetical protein
MHSVGISQYLNATTTLKRQGLQRHTAGVEPFHTRPTLLSLAWHRDFDAI